jgi:hypothetical protein
MITAEDIEAMREGLSDDERDDMDALYRAAAKVVNGSPSFMEFPAQDTRKIIRAALIGWERWAQAVASERVTGSISMAVYDQNGNETS